MSVHWPDSGPSATEDNAVFSAYDPARTPACRVEDTRTELRESPRSGENALARGFADRKHRRMTDLSLDGDRVEALLESHPIRPRRSGECHWNRTIRPFFNRNSLVTKG